MFKLLLALLAGGATYLVAFAGLESYSSAHYWGVPETTLQLYALGAAALAFVVLLNMLTYVHLRVQQHINGFILLILLTSGGFVAWQQIVPVLMRYIAP